MAGSFAAGFTGSKTKERGQKIMMSTQTKEMMTARAAIYRFLARLIQTEPDNEYLTVLKSVSLSDMGFKGNLGEIARRFDEYMKKSEDEETLAVDFAKTILGAGISEAAAAFPYESVYTSPKRIIMQDAWVKMHEMISSQGIKVVGDTTNLMEDHLSVELNYMALLCENDDDDIDEQLKDVNHLKKYIFINSCNNVLPCSK